jgi:hypothetical protein
VWSASIFRVFNLAVLQSELWTAVKMQFAPNNPALSIYLITLCYEQMNVIIIIITERLKTAIGDRTVNLFGD